MKSFLKQHLLVVIAALGVSLIYGGGHLMQIAYHGFDRYEPITVASHPESAVTYPIRAQAVYQGDWIVGDVNVVEHTDSPAYLSIANPMIMGSLARMTGSFKTAVIMSDFVFPSVIFVLFYILFYGFTRNKWLSLLTASVAIFILNVPLWGWRQFVNPPLVSFPYERFDYPKLTMVFYLTALVGTYYSLMKRRAWLIVFTGIAAGALFYTDLFDWVTFFAGLMILGAVFLWQRRWDHMKTLGMVVGIGLVVSIGYWINFFKLTHLPQYADIAARVGVEYSHALRFFTWDLYARVAALIAAVIVLVRKRNSMLAMYLIAFLIPFFGTLNLQVLTGMNPQPDHWVRPLLPMMYGALAVVALYIRERYCSRISPRMLRISAMVIIIFLFAGEAAYAVHAQSRKYPLQVMPEQTAKSYQWMREHIPVDAVVGSIAPATNLDVQLYTQAKLFVPFGLNTVASNDEIWQRFLYTASLYKLTPDQVRDLFADRAEAELWEDMSVYLFQNGYYDTSLNAYFKGSKRLVPVSALDDMILQYLIGASKKPPYQLDYIFYGPAEKQLGQDPIRVNPKLRTVYKDDEVTIYQL